MVFSTNLAQIRDFIITGNILTADSTLDNLLTFITNHINLLTPLQRERWSATINELNHIKEHLARPDLTATIENPHRQKLLRYIDSIKAI